MPDKTLPERHTEEVFHGTVQLDVRDSTPDWRPYSPPVPAHASPNVLFVLYDDTGLATWSPFGGRVQMPTAQRWRTTG